MAEREWFRLLTSVQGVGGRVALAILSTLSPDELQTAIARADKAMIARANGVGPKLALRIATVLKDKVSGPALGTGSVTVSPGCCYGEDAVSALMHLGLGPGDARLAATRSDNALGPQHSCAA